MAFRFSFTREGAGTTPSRRVVPRTRKKKKTEKTLTAWERRQKQEREIKKKINLRNKKKEKEALELENYNRFARLHNTLVEKRVDPRTVPGTEFYRGRAPKVKDYNLPPSSKPIPGRYDIPHASDNVGWQKLFDDIDGTYRFGAPVLPDVPTSVVHNENEIRENRHRLTHKALQDPRVKYDPETGSLSHYTTSDLTLVNPRTKKKHLYKNIVQYNTPRNALREFPTMEQYLETGRDHVIMDRDGNPRSLATLARQASLQTRPLGHYYTKVSGTPVVVRRADWKEEQPSLTPGGNPTSSSQIIRGHVKVTLPISDYVKPGDEKSYTIPDNELPDPHVHGWSGVQQILDRVGNPFTVEDLRSTAPYEQEWPKPNQTSKYVHTGWTVRKSDGKTIKSWTLQPIGDRTVTKLGGPKKEVSFITSLNPKNEADVQQWAENRTPEVHGDLYKPGSHDLVWQNEHGQKRTLSSYVQHIGDRPHAFGLPELSAPPYRDSSTIKTDLDPRKASREEVESLLQKHINGDLTGRRLPDVESILDGIRLNNHSGGDRVVIPGLDDLHLDHHLVDYQLNGKPMRNTLGRFLEHHFAGEAERDATNHSGLVFTNPAHSTMEDIDALVHHATNGEIANARQFARVHLRGNPAAHRAVDIGVLGDIRPTRNKKWGINTLYSPSHDGETAATRNLDDVFTSMGGNNLYTQQGMIPHLAGDNLDQAVKYATKGQYQNAHDYSSALTDAMENGGDLTEFKSHHLLLDRDNKLITFRKTPLPKKFQSNLAIKLGNGLVPKSATQAIHLASYFRPALVMHDNERTQYLPDQAPTHIPTATPNFGKIESDYAPPLHSSIEEDAADIGNFGVPVIDTEHGSIVGLPRHDRTNGRENANWVTSNQFHTCPQCAASVCTKCGQQVARNKISPVDNTHKPEFQDECLDFLNRNSSFVDNP